MPSDETSATKMVQKEKSFSKLNTIQVVKGREAWHAAVHEVAESDTTKRPNSNNTN